MKSPAADSLFGTFKKSSISEDIVANLLSLIRERELRPGDKLPPERELAAMMQVSRPSLREALRALVGAVQWLGNVAIWVLVFLLPLLILAAIPLVVLYFVVRWLIRRSRKPAPSVTT